MTKRRPNAQVQRLVAATSLLALSRAEVVYALGIREAVRPEALYDVARSRQGLGFLLDDVVEDEGVEEDGECQAEEEAEQEDVGEARDRGEDEEVADGDACKRDNRRLALKGAMKGSLRFDSSRVCSGK